MSLVMDLAEEEDPAMPLSDDGAARQNDDVATSALWGVLVLAIAVFFVDRGFDRLFSDYRFDENITGWVSSDGLWDTIVRSWNNQGQSPLYFVIVWVWQQLAGTSEFAVRIPSLVALGAAMWHLIGIGQDVGRKSLGIVAAIFLVSTDVGAADARPYIFLVLSVVLALRYGLRWSSPSGSLTDGVRWAVFGVLALYFHPLAIYALMPHLLLSIRARNLGRSRQTTALIVLGGLLALPLIPQMLALGSRGDSLVLVPLPGFDSLRGGVLPGALGMAILLAALANVDWRWLRSVPNPRFAIFAFGTVSPALGLFVQSWITGNAVFVDRYWTAAIPLAGLVLGHLLSNMRNYAMIIGCLVPVIAGVPTFGVETDLPDWAYAAAVIEQASPDSEIWAMAGLIESYHPGYFETTDANDYLSGHFILHGAEREILSVPAGVSDEFNPIYDRHVERVSSTGAPVTIVQVSDGAFVPSIQYAIDQLVANGYEVADLDFESDILTARLERP